MSAPSRLLRRPPARFRALASVAVLLATAVVAGAQTVSTIPARLSNQEFWRLNSQFSEPNGYFRSDNFLSNETGYQYVIPELRELIRPGGVYLGVGPEQNFTYIVALRPSMAIIVDIRRGNMIAHLMYKALMELSPDRAEFLSRLFSRARPAGLDTNSTPAELFDAYAAAAPDSVLFTRNLAAVRARLTKGHGFVMSDSDSKLLDYTYSAYFDGGPEISYNFRRAGVVGPFGRFRGGFGYGMPTYASLQTATDSAGKNWAFLATEANYRWLRDFESRNLVVPAVGDFGGPTAIRAVARYLDAHHAVVSAFYTSNVEQYLFQQDDAWSRFYQNVATLPIDSASSFIRSIGGGYRSGGLPPRAAMQQAALGGRLASVTSSIQELLKAFTDGRILAYRDVISLSR